MTMESARDIGVYIHVPFCKQRCHFCAFYLEVARTERMDAFRLALEREIDCYRRQDVIGHRPLRSLYFGGGTPTVLPAIQLASLLRSARTVWPTDPSVEITVEAHPSTVTASDLTMLAEAGFNRISFGAESMDERDFAPIGRPGSVRDTDVAVDAARSAGFTNISLDLMYGLPGQSLASWQTTVHTVLTLEPTHVSCYALTVEDGTRFAHDVARNLVPTPDEALHVEMESAAETILQEAGLLRYEISNYAKPGFASRHNLLYWTNGDYLGLGPSAQSYVNGRRFGNVADLTAYIDLLNRHRLPLEEQADLSLDEQQRDALVFGLRLIEGVPRRLVRPDMPQHQIIASLGRQGLLTWDKDYIRLTDLGRQYADSVCQELY